ncbi:site-specific integrase [Salipaludibacillus agaradhaerens]|jgi:integrase|uniref:Site-specific integrase n=1 Tax=Salipaludibacillus agaradhaerens TaxID=76935 RepID=A0A9Q4FYK7_SALAG|nr:site-specific integrase [Salipaludibacillus agaradhaerens]MCR6097770.1 site-specific integrase [Salipaludibacillus agaradhaerens]MCR6112746.1 site-specific integrase [Salipaludibacillus agaradhaerens]
MYCKKVQTKSGDKWECVADGPKNPATGKRKQVTRRAKTQKEAKKRLESALRSLGEYQIDEQLGKKITFESVAEHWIKVYSLTGVKKSTVRVREKEIKILNRHIAKTPVAMITHSQYQKSLHDIAPDYARTTVQGVNTTAGMIFRHAIKDKLIRDNPTNGAIVPKKRRTVEEIENNDIEEKYLESAEVDEFLQAVRNHGLDLDLERFYLLAFSGMRSGELLALKWTDLNFKDNEIRITKTIYNENNNMKTYELTPPKTEGSIRSIEIEDEIMNQLESHRKRQLKVKMKYRAEIEDYHDGNFIFCRPNGYPFIQKNIITRMQRLLDKTNITKHATPHIFRHTHVSMLAEAGVDLSTIMKRVGHEDIKTTMKIYTHVTDKMKKDANAKVKTLYENALSEINFKIM